MSLPLDAKSKECMELVDACLRRQKHLTAVAGRAYYAVFQRIKHLLETEGFDYQGFLSAVGRQDERPFSHGTIVPALWDHLRKTRKSIAFTDLQEFVPLDQLYSVRRKSEYDAGYEVDDKNLRWCYGKASQMLSVLGSL